MNRDYYIRQINSQLYPVLREEGFKGSGTTLRRHLEPVVHVFNFQASTGGDCCYINLGVHLEFLPTEGGGVCDSQEISEPQCAFRRRLEPPAGSMFGWQYGETERAAAESIAMLLDYWRCFGQPFFASLCSYPRDYLPLIDAAIMKPPHPYEGLKLARLALHMELKDLALKLANDALPKVGDRATGLLANLNALIHSCQA